MPNTYMMREDKERCELRYIFEADDTEKITQVELAPTIANDKGIERRIYERADDSSHLKYWIKTTILETKPLPERFRGMEPGSEKEMEYFAWLVSAEGRKEHQQRYTHRVEESEKTLVERLRVNNPIVRDAFGEGITAGQLFREYHLIPAGNMIGAPHLSPLGRMCGCSGD